MVLSEGKMRFLPSPQALFASSFDIAVKAVKAKNTT
jgi:hypothetical protein